MDKKIDKILTELTKGKIDYKFIIENKTLIEKEYFPQMEELIYEKSDNPKCVLGNAIFIYLILSTILGHKEASEFALYPFKIHSLRRADKIFGDLIFEALPFCLYASGDIDFSRLEKLLLNKGKDMNKTIILSKYFKQCYEHNCLDRAYEFIENNKMKCLFDCFETDLVALVSIFDQKRAIDLLDYFDSNKRFSYMMFGNYWEAKALIYRNAINTTTDILLSYEECVDTMLSKLSKAFKWNVKNYDFLPKKENDSDEGDKFYKFLDKVEANINDIFDSFKTNKKMKEETVIEQLFALDVEYFYDNIETNLSEDMLKIDKKFFITSIADNLIPLDNKNKRLDNLMIELINQVLVEYRDTCEDEYYSFEDYNKNALYFKTYHIESLAEEISWSDYLEEFDFEVDKTHTA